MPNVPKAFYENYLEQSHRGQFVFANPCGKMPKPDAGMTKGRWKPNIGKTDAMFLLFGAGLRCTELFSPIGRGRRPAPNEQRLGRSLALPRLSSSNRLTSNRFDVSDDSRNRRHPPEVEESRGVELERNRNRKMAYQYRMNMSQMQSPQHFAPRRVIPSWANARSLTASEKWNHL